MTTTRATAGVDVDRDPAQLGATRRGDTRDRLPEEAVYQDTGCEVSPACVDCPLLVCRYDIPVPVQRALERVREIRELLDRGFGCRAVARQVHVGIRTVERIQADPGYMEEQFEVLRRLRRLGGSS